jgi:hypothetical protein
MWEHFKCFSVKILDYYNITARLLVCNKLSESIMHGATIKTLKYEMIANRTENCRSYLNNEHVSQLTKGNRNLLHRT